MNYYPNADSIHRQPVRNSMRIGQQVREEE